MSDLLYDIKNPQSIERYAKQLIGKTFLDVCNEYYKKNNLSVRDNGKHVSIYENYSMKGGLGQVIEEIYFGYSPNSFQQADFYEAGVELKVTPFKKNRNNSISAKERLILTMIDYYAVVNEAFESSHMWNKSKLILLIFYLYQQEIENRLDYPIKFVNLFTPPEEDIQIIKKDFEFIKNKIMSGKAHELSESDTLYLGAAPKAANSSVTRKQPFSSEPAKPRAFAFKNSYMTFVLNNYIANKKERIESIIKTKTELPFEEIIVNKINSYKGYSVINLCETFNEKFKNKPKNLESLLTYRMLGIKGNKASEFIKANIVIKIIRLEYNNKIKENMSFPTFKFKEIIKQDWETSDLYVYLSETKFLFVVYKYDKSGILRLKGCQFWNIPYLDLNEEVYQVWCRTKSILNDGLQINFINGRYKNNFPKSSENRVSHVRPHARNAEDTDELPDGRKFPKQCFWFNNKYILSQLNNEFFD